MKIENNSYLPRSAVSAYVAVFSVAIGVMAFAVSGAFAADATMPADSIPVIAAPASVPQLSASSTNLAKAPGEDIQKSISVMEDKVSENAKNLVKRLDSGSDTTTFADLNSARQTVTRIEAMIDVEKHLVELEKLRSERGGIHTASSSAATSLASAIPASALAPPPPPPPTSQPIMHQMPERPTPAPVVSHSHPEVSRIYGTDGKYTAILKLPGGEMKSVKVGELLPNNEKVSSISASSVAVEGKDASYTLHIKNVDAIYSAMR